MSNTTPTPRTLLEAMELISQLRSRKAVYQTAIAHLRTCYKDTDAGAAEMRISREDLAVVNQEHLEKSIGEMMDRIEQLDVEIELLQNQPIGGAPPAAAQPVVGAEAATSEDTAIAEAARATGAAKTKGTPSGKSRASSGGAS